MSRKTDPFGDTPSRDASQAKLEAVEAMIGVMDRRLVERLESIAAAIDALAINVAQLTAQQKQTANNLDKIGDRLDRMTDAIQGHLKLAESQAANVAALTNLATAIVGARAA